ncbi:MAG: hypothetical protein LUF89_08700 [Ruminococcus sp.]|nr:hypothetical protein [Ruminococcus sp.]
MPFFVPRRFIELEYLRDDKPKKYTEQEEKENAKYSKLQDFAFFAANFGYSKVEYEILTPTEKAFLLKAYEEKVVSDSSLLASAVANAVGNVLRKKGKRPQKLWKKKPKPGNVEQRDSDVEIAKRNAEKDGNAWIARIYAANHRKLKRRSAPPENRK